MVIFQDDAFAAIPSVTVLPLTSDLVNFPLVRLDVRPTAGNGLQQHSQIMIDKLGTLRRDKITRHIGRLEAATVRTAGAALRRFLGLN
jgi:mRNA interferase MazF